MKIKVLSTYFLTLASYSAWAQDSLKKDGRFFMNAFIDVYYSYDFNKPSDHEKAHFIYNHNRHNEVTINLALISLAYIDSKKRANLALMAGTYPQYNLASEPELLRYIYEANVGVKLSGSKELWLDVGILPSHIGFESAISKDCWTLTRSLLAENSPYYEAGLRASYKTPNQKWYFAVLLLNGWQRIKRKDGNNTPAFGTQITYHPTDKFSINSSTFIGNDKPDSIRQMRYFHNFYGIFRLSRKLSVTTGFDIGAEQIAVGSSQLNTWYSPVIITRFTASPKFTFAARMEYYKDKHEIIISTNTANGFQTFGYSVNIDYEIHKNFYWRVEARTLKSKDPIFENANTMSSSSVWLTTTLSLTF